MAVNVFDFIGRIEVFYGKEYSYQQLTEMKDFLKRQSLPDEFLEGMYDYMTETFKKLPAKADIATYIKGHKKEIVSDTGVPPLHPQSPMQMFYRYRDRSVKEILSRYFYLKAQLEKRELKSWEISYIHEWEIIGDVYGWNKDRNVPEDECYKRADLAVVEYSKAYSIPDVNERRREIANVREKYMPVGDKLSLRVNMKNMEG